MGTFYSKYWWNLSVPENHYLKVLYFLEILCLNKQCVQDKMLDYGNFLLYSIFQERKNEDLNNSSGEEIDIARRLLLLTNN